MKAGHHTRVAVCFCADDEDKHKHVAYSGEEFLSTCSPFFPLTPCMVSVQHHQMGMWEHRYHLTLTCLQLMTLPINY